MNNFRIIITRKPIFSVVFYFFMTLSALTGYDIDRSVGECAQAGF